MQIEQKIKDLEESLKDNDDNQKWDQLYAYKENMNELVKIKTQGAIIRSRQQWYDEGEKKSIFFQLRKAKFEPEIDQSTRIEWQYYHGRSTNYFKWNKTVLQNIIHENHHGWPYAILK